jgi:ABC-type branched-subunit amino acid transport system ATPase component
MSAILEVNDVKKSFGGLQALSGCSFSVVEGSITGLIGPNGSGKTTMFNVITGYETLDSGVVRIASRDVTGTAPGGVCRLGVGRTFQLTRVFSRLFKSVVEAFPKPSAKKCIATSGAKNFWHSWA